MIEINTMAAQGDVLFRRIARLPSSAVMQVTSGRVIVAHSETGHHHAIDDGAVRYFSEPGSPTLTYLAIDGQFADVVHHRPYDTHETLRLTKGLWEVRRQREWSPEGWRVVSD